MIPPTLEFVMKYFPEHKTSLEALYRQNESFRSLCADFLDCINAVAYWCGTLPVEKNAPVFCEEYKALCAELKEEITKWLMNQNNCA